MRILAIDNIFLTGSGGENHLVRVLRQWVETQDSEVSFMTPNTSRLLSRALYTGGHARIIAAIMISYAVRIVRIPFARLQGSFDVITTSSHYPPDLLSALLLRLRNRRAKLVVYVHGRFPEVSPTHGVALRILSLMYNYFGLMLAIRFGNLLFALNSHTKGRIVAMGGEDRRVVMSTNAVSNHDFGRLPKARLFDACFLGRVVPSKGIYDLVKIWKRISQHKGKAKLLVVGSGLTEQVKQLAAAEGILGNLLLTGYVPDERKLKLLRSSRLFLFPSYSEGWGIAIAEALSCGLPVVAYDLPVYREVFSNNLITVPLGDTEAMANRVVYLLENPAVAQEMGERGKQFVKRYDWKRVAERELSAIRTLLQRNN